MAISFTRQKPKTNRVSLPSNFGLPKDFIYGSISLSMSFEGWPTCNIAIKNIPESQIEEYLEAYKKDKKLTLRFSDRVCIAFQIASVSQSFNEVVAENIAPIRVWDLTVSLQHVNQIRFGHSVRVNTRTTSVERKISLGSLASKAKIKYSGFSEQCTIPKGSDKTFMMSFGSELEKYLRIKGRILDHNGVASTTPIASSGKDFTVTASDVEYAIDTSDSKKQGYRKTKLSGKDGPYFLDPKEDKDEQEYQIWGDQYALQRPKKVVLTEGDENPTKPPSDCVLIKSLDLNFDMSGPKKTTKKTTYLDGQVIQEEVWIYGCVYKANQVQNPAATDPNAPITTPTLLADPADHWRVVEYKKTEHIYTDIDVAVNITAVDPETKKKYKVVYNDKTKKGESAKTFSTKYLTQVRTTGWRLVRHKQESADGGDYDSRVINLNLNDPNIAEEDEAFYKTCKTAISFYKANVRESKRYVLTPMENLYTDTPPVPYQTKLIDASELGGINRRASGKVVIATPDPNYVYPMLITEESSLSSSFSTARNPENIEIKFEREAINEDDSLSNAEKEERLAEVPYVPDLITGQDTYEIIERKVLASRNSKKDEENEEVKSFELYVEYQYKQSSQDAQFQNCLEEGTYRQVMGRPPAASTFQQVYKKITQESQKKKSNRMNFLTYISSTSDPDIPEYTENLTFETNNRTKAIKGAKIELAVKNLNGWKQRSSNLRFYYPTLKPGDYLFFQDMPETIRWRIKGVSYTIDFNGFLDGTKFLTCDGTSVDLGIYEEDNLVVTRQKEDDENENGELDVKARFSGKRTLGVLDRPTSATRRARYNDPFIGTDIPPEK